MKATVFSLIKVLLLVSLLASLACAQSPRTSSCLCSAYQPTIGRNMQSINFYPANAFCDKLEIVVSMMDGRRFCLDINSRSSLYLQKKNKANASRSTNPTADPSVK